MHEVAGGLLVGEGDQQVHPILFGAEDVGAFFVVLVVFVRHGEQHELRGVDQLTRQHGVALLDRSGKLCFQGLRRFGHR
jgi:hypothetical protein